MRVLFFHLWILWQGEQVVYSCIFDFPVYRNPSALLKKNCPSQTPQRLSKFLCRCGPLSNQVRLRTSWSRPRPVLEPSGPVNTTDFRTLTVLRGRLSVVVLSVFPCSLPRCQLTRLLSPGFSSDSSFTVVVLQFLSPEVILSHRVTRTSMSLQFVHLSFSPTTLILFE